jgi:hypothetical protein
VLVIDVFGDGRGRRCGEKRSAVGVVKTESNETAWR